MMCDETKFENRVKNKKTFLLSKIMFFFFKQKRIFLFLGKYFLKILTNSMPRHLFAEADTKQK